MRWVLATDPSRFFEHYRLAKTFKTEFRWTDHVTFSTQNLYVSHARNLGGKF